MRRSPSRRMPKLPQPKTDAQKYVCGLMIALGLAALIATAIYCPLLLIVFLGGGLYTAYAFRQARLLRERKRLARQGESICTFARSFDCRARDTWIIRAVYEEFEAAVGFPIRRSDDFVDDLNIDLEDASVLLAPIAFRCGRTLEGMEQNPWYFQVRTIAHFIEFLHEQPSSR